MRGAGHADDLWYFKCPETKQMRYPVKAYKKRAWNLSQALAFLMVIPRGIEPRFPALEATELDFGYPIITENCNHANKLGCHYLLGFAGIYYP